MRVIVNWEPRNFRRVPRRDWSRVLDSVERRWWEVNRFHRGEGLTSPSLREGTRGAHPIVGGG
jgi:hypothetical protein